jgi:glyceraldehyde 3-phosphate dehydrogenase
LRPRHDCQCGDQRLGRIGRDYLRSALGADDLRVVAINDVTDSTTLARLLPHDSTFGLLHRDVEDRGDALIVDGQKIVVSSIREPAELASREHDVEIVIESSGKFRTREAAQGHLAAGARARC